MGIMYITENESETQKMVLEGETNTTESRVAAKQYTKKRRERKTRTLKD